MKLVALVLLLLSFLAGALGAAGDVGEACAAGSTCTSPNAYCTSSTKCACKANYVQKGTGCARVADQPCGSGQCGDGLVCSNGTCAVCPTGQTLKDGTCLKKIGQPCNAVADCVTEPGVICSTSAQKCTCNTTAHFDAGIDGAGRCQCADGYVFKSDNTCGKKILVCTLDTQCMKNAVCTNGDCVCDASNGYTASGTSCVCDTASNYVSKADGTCAIKAGGSCVGSKPCTDHATCTSGTNVCDCATGYTAITATGQCGCDTASNYVPKADGTCAIKAGGSCVGSKPCTDHATCNSGTNVCDCATGYTAITATGQCGCDTASNYVLKADGTCAIKVGSSCAGSKPCTDHATCTSGTDVCDCATGYTAITATGQCGCDTASNYVSKADGTCAIKAGSNCAGSKPCTDHATCTSGTNVCDCVTDYTAITATGQCACKTDYEPRTSSTCGQRIAGASCSVESDCVDHASCTGNVCLCKTGYKASTSGLCACDTAGDYVLKADGSCGKKIGKSCGGDSDCLDHGKCSGGVCACDTANHFVASGTTSCGCDNNYSPKSAGGCGKNIGQSCSTAADCVDNALCTNSLCACDATKGFAGAPTCSCTAANYGPRSDGTCGKQVGQTCTTNADCIADAVCDLATSLCACDADNGYAVSGATCTCSVSNWGSKSDGGCGKVVSQSCEASPCADNAQCGAASGMCECNSGFIADTSKVCKNSGASMASATSLLLIVGALLLLC